MLGLFRTKQNEVGIENIENFMKSEFGRDIESAERRLSRLEEQIFSEMEALKKSFQELNLIENANTFTSNLKNKYCRKAFDSIGAIPQPGRDYAGKKAFIESCISSVSSISDIDIKEFRHLGIFNIKMSKISSQISQIKRLCSAYQASIKDSRLADVSAAASMAHDIKNKYQAYMSLEEELGTGERSVSFIETKISSLKISIAENGKELEEMEERRTDVSEDEKQKNTIETALSTEFGSIERSLRKFLHDCENSIEKNDIEMLKRYLDDPGGTFLYHDDGSIIRRNLIKMREAAIRGEFSPDDKVEKLDRMIRSVDFFLSMKQQYQGLSRSLEKFHKKIDEQKNPLIAQKQSAESEIEKLSAELSRLNESMKRKRSESAAFRKELEGDIGNLKSWTSKKCGRAMTIKHSFAF